MLDQEYDSNNAILSIHAGSGGLDAQDWAKDAAEDVHAICAGNEIQCKELDYNPGSGGRNKICDPQDFRRERIRLPEKSERRAPPGADVPV